MAEVKTFYLFFLYSQYQYFKKDYREVYFTMMMDCNQKQKTVDKLIRVQQQCEVPMENVYKN